MGNMNKPDCGTNIDDEVYNLPLHIAAIFIVFLASITGAGFPVFARRAKWMKIPLKVFFVCKHFGTGVLIATAFVHLVPTAFASLTNPCLPNLFTKRFTAMPGAIMLSSLLTLFAINMWLDTRTGGHSHGSATGLEFAGDLAPSDIEPGLRISVPHQGRHDSNKTTNVRDADGNWTLVNIPPPRADVDEDVEHEVDPLILKKQSLQITLIEGGILFHSVFIGITVSVTANGFITLLIAIVFHQIFEGLGLGSRIAAVPYPRGSWKPWVLVTAYGTTAPIGQIIGLATRSTYDPNSAFGLVLVGVCNAISSGLLIYASLIGLLAEDFLSEEANRTLTGKDKTAAFCFVLMGATVMTIVGAFA
ncbi:Zinc/iron permease, partial [Dothidotthia symphoricarpi CBS 119687]